jgi:hypothetical protein
VSAHEGGGGAGQGAPVTADPAVTEAVRRVLIRTAAEGETISYRDLAVAAAVPPPHTIHKTTLALEALAQADHAAGRALLSAVAVSKTGRPRPGFFEWLAALGRYHGPAAGPQAEAWHERELAEAHAAWRSTNGQPRHRPAFGEGRRGTPDRGAD